MGTQEGRQAGDQQGFLDFTILEEVFPKDNGNSSIARCNQKDNLAASSRTMSGCIWERLPEALLLIVLLYLPASSQARLQRVCRRWRQLVSSEEFRVWSAAIAFNSHQEPRLVPASVRMGSGGAMYRCSLQKCAPGAAFKVHRMSLDTFPQDLRQVVFDAATGYSHYFGDIQWLAEGGVQAVLLPLQSSLRVCTLDLAEAATNSSTCIWRELPLLVHRLGPRYRSNEPGHRYGSFDQMHARLYDVIYDRQQRRWSFRLFVSFSGCFRGDGEAGTKFRFCDYSSTSNSWTVTNPAPPLQSFKNSLILPARLRKCNIVHVGRGPAPNNVHIYVKSDEHMVTCEDACCAGVHIVRLNMEGQYVSSLPALQFLRGERWDRLWFFLDPNGTPFCVTFACAIFKCSDGDGDASTGLPQHEQWVKVSSLPRELRTQVKGEWPTNEKGAMIMREAAMVGSVIFLSVMGGADHHRGLAYHILAYHIRDDSWKWVAQFEGVGAPPRAMLPTSR